MIVPLSENNEPKFSWGMTNQLTYKNFDLSIVLQGVHGRDVLFLGKRFFTQLEGNMNQSGKCSTDGNLRKIRETAKLHAQMP